MKNIEDDDLFFSCLKTDSLGTDLNGMEIRCVIFNEVDEDLFFALDEY
jgi:hypothetical protein